MRYLLSKLEGRPIESDEEEESEEEVKKKVHMRVHVTVDLDVLEDRMKKNSSRLDH